MKTRIDLRVDKDLKDFIQAYARDNHTTVSHILIDYMVRLKKRHAKSLSVPNLSDAETTSDL
jgi:uncharacterized protein (DUF1778 family)